MELPTLFSPLLEFQRFELMMVRRRWGRGWGRERLGGGGARTQMLDHLLEISVHYLQHVCLLITGLMHNMNINSWVIATTDRK